MPRDGGSSADSNMQSFASSLICIIGHIMWFFTNIPWNIPLIAHDPTEIRALMFPHWQLAREFEKNVVSVPDEDVMTVRRRQRAKNHDKLSKLGVVKCIFAGFGGFINSFIGFCFGWANGGLKADDTGMVVGVLTFFGTAGLLNFVTIAQMYYSKGYPGHFVSEGHRCREAGKSVDERVLRMVGVVIPEATVRTGSLRSLLSEQKGANNSFFVMQAVILSHYLVAGIAALVLSHVAVWSTEDSTYELNCASSLSASDTDVICGTGFCCRVLRRRPDLYTLMTYVAGIYVFGYFAAHFTLNFVVETACNPPSGRTYRPSLIGFDAKRSFEEDQMGGAMWLYGKPSHGRVPKRGTTVIIKELSNLQEYNGREAVVLSEGLEEDGKLRVSIDGQVCSILPRHVQKSAPGGTKQPSAPPRKLNKTMLKNGVGRAAGGSTWALHGDNMVGSFMAERKTTADSINWLEDNDLGSPNRRDRDERKTERIKKRFSDAKESARRKLAEMDEPPSAKPVQYETEEAPMKKKPIMGGAAISPRKEVIPVMDEPPSAKPVQYEKEEAPIMGGAEVPVPPQPKPPTSYGRSMSMLKLRFKTVFDDNNIDKIGLDRKQFSSCLDQLHLSMSKIEMNKYLTDHRIDFDEFCEVLSHADNVEHVGKSFKLDDLYDTWRHLDENSDGRVNIQELQHLLNSEKEGTQVVFDTLDTNHDGIISFDELVEFFLGERVDNVEHLRIAFESFPMSDKGTIEGSKVQDAVRTMFPQRQAFNQLSKEMKINPRMEITFAKYVQMMRHPTLKTMNIEYYKGADIAKSRRQRLAQDQ